MGTDSSKTAAPSPLGDLRDCDRVWLADNVIGPLQKSGYRVHLFGSRARGSHRPFSDVDLLIDGSEQLSLALLGELRERLELGPLPFKVDLVEWSSLAESYREEVLAARKLL